MNLQLGQAACDRLIRSPDVTVQEADVLRRALLAQVRVMTVKLASKYRALPDHGSERWAEEDNLASDAHDVAVLAEILAELGRAIDDWRLEHILPPGGSPAPDTSPVA